MSEYGDVSIAAYGIVQKVGTIAIQITVGLTQGIMPLLGYCYGANDIKRLKEINRFAFLLLGCCAALCVIIVELFAQPLIMLFISEAATLEKGVLFPMLVIMNSLVGEIGLVCAQPVADTVALLLGITLYAVLMRKHIQ